MKASAVRALAWLPVAAILGCHSAHVGVVVENRTGMQVRQLEVDYPSASFGSDSLAVNGTLNYSIQLRGQGSLKVQFTTSDGHPWEAGGPSLQEGQEGTLEIDLLPGGKAEFHPAIKASR